MYLQCIENKQPHKTKDEKEYKLKSNFISEGQAHHSRLKKSLGYAFCTSHIWDYEDMMLHCNSPGHNYFVSENDSGSNYWKEEAMQASQKHSGSTFIWR